jgi:class 3 adenylate cyclase
MKNALVLSSHRQLAVVMFLDMVGYSSRMASEEKNAMVCVEDLGCILEETVPAHGGRLVKFMGDGSMSCFPTAIQAVSSALKTLERIRARNRRFPPRQQFKVRIGLHLGDVVFEKGDLFGDAVNVAARVQPWADPGGIAMTGIVYFQVRNKIRLPGFFLPPVKLKNIPEIIPLYSVAPPERNLFLWKLGKRRKEIQLALILLTGALVLSNMGYLRSHPGSDHWALLGVLSPPDENSVKTAEAVRFQAEMDFNGLSNIQWVDRQTALGILRQGGVSDPVGAAENLDLNATHAAWIGGLSHLVLFQLDSPGPGQWKLQCRILNTRGRVVVASFTAEGGDIRFLVGKLRRQTEEWIEQHHD